MIYTKTFPCGMKFAFKRSKSAVAYCALSVKSGTRNEPEALCGIAHMTEHMLFKGTEKRTPNQINNRLESLGGDLNAYTTKEETVIYATVLREDTAKAADLLFELAFTSVFPEKELVKERSVVLDEISMYEDSPSECIYDDFEGMLFAGHRLSRSILGSARTLRKMTSDDLRSYVADNFTPERMCISLVANMTPQRAERMVTEAFYKYAPQGAAAGGGPQTGAPDGDLKDDFVPFRREVTRKDHQVNCIVGSRAYSLYDVRRMPLILLCNILGGPSSNSRLNQTLREKNALVYNVDCSYTQYSDTGSVLIGFGCEKGHLDKCLELIDRQVAHLRDVELSETALRAAKKQLLGQLAISSDNGEAQALSMGKSMISFGEILPDEEIRRRIAAITASELRQVACEVFAPEKLSTLIYR